MVRHSSAKQLRKKKPAVILAVSFHAPIETLLIVSIYAVYLDGDTRQKPSPPSCVTNKRRCFGGMSSYGSYCEWLD
jgi:hypothetical protein